MPSSFLYQPVQHLWQGFILTILELGLTNSESGHREYTNQYFVIPSTYDHRVWKTGLPVRSAVLKPHAGWLVVGWVTTSESQLLYVFLLISRFSLFFLSH
jgi:hypothetical protein